LLHDCQQVLETLTPREQEVRTDEGRVCLRRIVPYRTLDNKIEGIVLTFTDVTALKRAMERQRLLATVLMDSNDAILVRDFAGRITVWNQAAQRMYGYTEAEALAMSAELLVPPALRAETAAMLERLRQGQSVDVWETQRSCKDGRVLDVSIALTTLRDDAGQPVAVAATARDITGRKRTEQVIRELNATLEQRIAERTAELETLNHSLQAEIAERTRMEEALRESGERLAAMVNATSEEQQRIGQDLHDSVGQELTGLGLMAESLTETFTDKTQPAADITQKIVAGIRRALKQVRSLSRGLIPVEVDAEGLMSALGGLAEHSNDISGRHCVCTFTCAEPVLLDDNATATHLYHIAQEAVSNALKHSHAQHIDIGLQADGARLTLTVRDDGDGMPPEQRESKGMGLKIMRYRAGVINATLKIGVADGGGTEVSCVLMRGESDGTQKDNVRDEKRPRSDRR
jgi:PAS domain S-box-containing protein